MHVDVRQLPGVNFVWDFTKLPLPIKDEDFAGVYSSFCLEHLPFAIVPDFLADIRRILVPGGKVVLVTPNTEAQMKWILENPKGWDGKPAFHAMSELLYGSQSYAENSHASYFNPVLMDNLLQAAGFVNILVQPYGERRTDMLVTAEKPNPFKGLRTQIDQLTEQERRLTPAVELPQEGDEDPTCSGPNPFALPHEPTQSHAFIPVPQPEPPKPALPAPEVLYDRHYFNGGAKWGGYAREGYWDFPVHNVTAQHILNRRPASVLELGAARGYVGKRLEDAGVRYTGLEVSRHCYLTRVSENVEQADLLKPWPVADQSHELCFSAAVLEHIPEQHIPAVLAEMVRTCKRGLHGIDFGDHDDGFDRSHATLKPRQWWVDTFAKYAPGWPVEILDKEDLERGTFPEDVLKGDGKLKLNLGSCQTMFHHGWQNLDALDLGQWAQSYGYQFTRCDLRAGLPYATGTASLIMLHHVLEHMSYEEGLQFLRDCRRVLRPDGAMRAAVPDAQLLAKLYLGTDHHIDGYQSMSSPASYAELNAAVGKGTRLQGYWELLHAGHAAAYDEETLINQLQDAGFSVHRARFRTTHVPAVQQILRESIEYSYGGISLFMDAVPALG